MPWTCTRCESINIDTDTICEVCDELQQRSTRVRARAIAAGEGHSLAVTEKGTVVAWGLNVEGQTDVPSGLNNVIAVAAGVLHSLALKSDGTVVAWGVSHGDTDYDDYGQSNAPYGLSNVKAIAAGSYHSLALTEDGTVVAWGSNSNGEIDVPSDLYDVIAITAGHGFSLALTEDGIVVGWGNNEFGQIGVEFIKDKYRFIAIAAGSYHSLALTEYGIVVAWGDNSDGNINVPVGLRNVTAIAAGTHYSLALTDEGTVVTWGSNVRGKIDVPIDLYDVIAIAVDVHSLALTTHGTIVGWGNNFSGQINVPEIFRNSPEVNRADTPTSIHPYDIGITLYKNKKHTAALDYFTKHIASLRTSVTNYSRASNIFLLANALFWVGCIHYQRGEFDRALQVLSESLPLSRKLVTKRGLPDDIRNLSELLDLIKKTALRI
jgi:alpha-tubulin suppressor-like RCC1 family protein